MHSILLIKLIVWKNKKDKYKWKKAGGKEKKTRQCSERVR